jgi:hypothetical protein
LDFAAEAFTREPEEAQSFAFEVHAVLDVPDGEQDEVEEAFRPAGGIESLMGRQTL